jgi:hypothetical protein
MAAPQTRFGTIPLRILRGSTGAQIGAGWSRKSNTAEQPVPGSDRTITFLLGRGPRDVTWRVECLADDYLDLEAAIQSDATLVVPHGTQNAPAIVRNEFGDLYDHLDGVLLMGLSNETVHRTNRGQTVQADAWFRMPSP